MDTEGAGFVTAGSYYAATLGSSDNEGTPAQGTVVQTLDRYKEGIEVQMKDGSFNHDFSIFS